MIVIKINYSSVSPVVNVNYDESPIYVRVMYGGAGDSITEWGEIVGTLSNQTDLQNALNAKVPYSGATANVDLGEYELKAGQIELDQSPTGVAGVAVTRWNDTIGSTETTLKGGSVVLKNGVDLVARIVNKVTPNTTLTKAAYQAVRISGAQGQRLAVAFAQANNDNNSADTIGLVTETIATNQEGFIMTVGSLEGINTTGSLQGETWSDGDVLYLSPTVAGAITNVKPVAPQHLVVIGYVEYAHQNNGKIYVKVMNGWELGELHDVNTNGATNGQVLTYNGSIWVPSTNGVGTVTSVAATAGTGISVSGSPITSSGTLTITNTAPDQVVSLTQGGTTTITGTYPNFTISSADQYTGTVTSVGLTSSTTGLTITGSPVTTSGNVNLEIATASGSATGLLSSTDWTTFNNKQNALTNPITGTGTSGQIAYWSGTNTQTGSATLTYSPTSSLLVNNSVTAASAIARGTNLTPTLVAAANNDVLVGLDINPTFTVGAFTGLSNFGIRINQVSAASEPLRIQMVASPTGDAIVVKNSSNTTIYRVGSDGSMVSARWYDANNLSTLLSFPSNNFNVQLNGTSFLRLFNSTGNLVLQNGGTFTDGGQRLQVTGTGYFSGNVGIGIASTVTTQNLIVQSNITGATAATGIQSSSQIQSDVTSTARYYLAFGRVQNTSFTLSNIVYYDAEEFSLTGPTITNQFGYRVGALSTATNNYGFYGNIASGTNRWNLYMNGTANNYMAGSLGIGTTSLTAFNLVVSKTLTGGTVARSIYTTSVIQSDVTNVALYYSTDAATQATTFTLGNLRHYQAAVAGFGAGSTITTQSGFYVASSMVGATNNYGFHGDIQSGTGRWNIYMGGTADNYMAGSLGIGSTSLSSISLRIAKSITGSTSIDNVVVDGTVQSDVTNIVNNFNSTLRTQATTFTLTNYRHFYASQATLGASSSVSNQIGFFVDSNLIGASNNYGFRGIIPSGTNRWNIYMDGTADNYMAGSLGIGSTSLTGINLKVNKNLTGATSSYSIDNTSAILSDVTSNGIYYNTYANTQSANFSLANIVHYQAGGISTFANVTAGGTVTNQTGFLVLSSTIGATNNYGFRGAIPSGTNRWNLYMDGTANNYMAGSLGIGVTNPSTSLDISANVATTVPLVKLTNTRTYTSSYSKAIDIFAPNIGAGTGSFTAFYVGKSASTNNGFGVNYYHVADGSASNYGDISFYGADNILVWNAAKDIAINTTTFGTATKLTLGGSETASSAIARGQLINTTLVAAANNDILVGLDVNPTFTNGAFTGLNNYGLRVIGNATGVSSSIFLRQPSNTTNTWICVRNSDSYSTAGTVSVDFGLVGSAGSFFTGTVQGDSFLKAFSLANTSRLHIGASSGFAANIVCFSTGNVSIFSTTDSGFRLDVNGTARVQGQVVVTGSTTAASGFARGISHTPTLVAAANNDVLVGLDIQPTFTNGAFTGLVNEALRLGGNLRFSSTNFAITNSLGNSIIGYSGTYWNFNSGTSGFGFRFLIFGAAQYALNIFSSSNVGINTTTDVSSAQFQVESTTKGFLPPRMTTTQKNAIATPAAGLQVYDTTLNQMSYYNGTTWVNF